MAKNYKKTGKVKFQKTDKVKYQKDQIWSKRWEKARKIGMLKYVLIYGLLVWGGLTALIFQLLSMYSKGFHYTNFKAQLISPTISLMIAGLMFGVSTWLSSENKYSKVNRK